MTDPTLDVVGIGNAIVDVLSQADEAFLAAQDLVKGSMTLIDGDLVGIDNLDSTLPAPKYLALPTNESEDNDES